MSGVISRVSVGSQPDSVSGWSPRYRVVILTLFDRGTRPGHLFTEKTKEDYRGITGALTLAETARVSGMVLIVAARSG